MIRQAFIASLWAGLIALDITAIGPFLIAQPMVAGPLFGFLVGHVAVGLIIGGIVQLLWMDVTPVGVGIPYDATAVTILAVYWASLGPTSSLSQMVLALLIAVPFGTIFKRMDQASRRVNTKILHRIEHVPDERITASLSLGIGLGLLWSLVRYAATYFVSMMAGAWLWQRIGYFPKDTWFDRSLTMAIILLPVAGLAVTLDLFMSEDPDSQWLKRLGFRGTRTSTGDRRRS